MLMMMGCIPMILGAEEYKEPEKINLNKGWEFSADGDIIRNREWEWNVGLNLSKVKNKVFLNLTKRQLVCMGFAAGIGVPFYFLMRDTLGTSNAAAGMVLLMLPEFFFALYEKNGMHLETILTNFISVRFKRPAVRRYEVENLYDRELETAAPMQKKGGILGKK